MGAIVFETGGLLVDHGWVRVLGGGHPRLPRTLPGWNAGRANGFYLVADDVIGGFFALDGGGLGGTIGQISYFGPNTLRWEALSVGYSEFLAWLLCGNLALFYQSWRWRGWQGEVASLPGDQVFGLSPPPWDEPGEGHCKPQPPPDTD